MCVEQAIAQVPFSARPSVSLKQKTTHSSPLEIPESIGTVCDSWQEGTEGVVYIVEDAHTSLEAQKNIARIVERIADDVQGLRLEDKGKRNVAAHPRMRPFVNGSIGRIHGSVPTPNNLLLCTEGFDGNLGKRIDSAFAHIENNAQRRDIANVLMRNGEMTGAQYAYLLQEGKIPIFGVEYQKEYKDNLAQFAKLISLHEYHADFFNLYDGTIQRLKEELYPPSLLSFDANIKRFKESQDVSSLAEVVASLLQKKIDLRPYPNLERLSQGEKIETVDFVRLLEECDALAYVYKHQSLSGDAKVLVEFERVIQLLEKLFTATLKRAEWHDFFQNRHAYIETLKTYEDWLKLHIPVLPARYSLQSEQFVAALKQAYQFYRYVRIRDKCMVKNTWRHMQWHKKQGAILVAGGFHTEGLKFYLREFNLSYVVIRPRVMSIDSQLRDMYYQKAVGKEVSGFGMLVNFIASSILLENVFTRVSLNTKQQQLCIDLVSLLRSESFEKAQSRLDEYRSTNEGGLLFTIAKAGNESHKQQHYLSVSDSQTGEQLHVSIDALGNIKTQIQKSELQQVQEMGGLRAYVEAHTDTYEREQVVKALEATKGIVSRAARLLKASHDYVDKRIKKHQIDVSSFASSEKDETSFAPVNIIEESDRLRSRIQERLLLLALKVANEERKKAAELLGTNSSTFNRMLHAYNIAGKSEAAFANTPRSIKARVERTLFQKIRRNENKIDPLVARIYKNLFQTLNGRKQTQNKYYIGFMNGLYGLNELCILMQLYEERLTDVQNAIELFDSLAMFRKVEKAIAQYKGKGFDEGTIEICLSRGLTYDAILRYAREKNITVANALARDKWMMDIPQFLLEHIEKEYDINQPVNFYEKESGNKALVNYRGIQFCFECRPSLNFYKDLREGHIWFKANAHKIIVSNKRTEHEWIFYVDEDDNGRYVCDLNGNPISQDARFISVPGNYNRMVYLSRFIPQWNKHYYPQIERLIEKRGTYTPRAVRQIFSRLHKELCEVGISQNDNLLKTYIFIAQKTGNKVLEKELNECRTEKKAEEIMIGLFSNQGLENRVLLIKLNHGFFIAKKNKKSMTKKEEEKIVPKETSFTPYEAIHALVENVPEKDYRFFVQNSEQRSWQVTNFMWQAMCSYRYKPNISDMNRRKALAQQISKLVNNSTIGKHLIRQDEKEVEKTIRTFFTVERESLKDMLAHRLESLRDLVYPRINGINPTKNEALIHVLQINIPEISEYGVEIITNLLGKEGETLNSFLWRFYTQSETAASQTKEEKSEVVPAPKRINLLESQTLRRAEYDLVLFSQLSREEQENYLSALEMLVGEKAKECDGQKADAVIALRKDRKEEQLFATHVMGVQLFTLKRRSSIAEAAGLRVKKLYERQGIGQKIRDKTYAHLSKQGFKRFVIHVDKNAEAQAFHVREIERLKGKLLGEINCQEDGEEIASFAIDLSAFSVKEKESFERDPNSLYVLNEPNRSKKEKKVVRLRYVRGDSLIREERAAILEQFSQWNSSLYQMRKHVSDVLKNSFHDSFNPKESYLQYCRFALDDEGTVLGWCEAVPSDWGAYHSRAFRLVKRIAVHPAHQGQGIGLELLAGVIREAVEAFPEGRIVLEDVQAPLYRILQQLYPDKIKHQPILRTKEIEVVFHLEGMNAVNPITFLRRHDMRIAERINRYGLSEKSYSAASVGKEQKKNLSFVSWIIALVGLSLIIDLCLGSSVSAAANASVSFDANVLMMSSAVAIPLSHKRPMRIDTKRHISVTSTGLLPYVEASRTKIMSRIQKVFTDYNVPDPLNTYKRYHTLRIGNTSIRFNRVSTANNRHITWAVEKKDLVQLTEWLGLDLRDEPYERETAQSDKQTLARRLPEIDEQTQHSLSGYSLSKICVGRVSDLNALLGEFVKTHSIPNPETYRDDTYVLSIGGKDIYLERVTTNGKRHIKWAFKHADTPTVARWLGLRLRSRQQEPHADPKLIHTFENIRKQYPRSEDYSVRGGKRVSNYERPVCDALFALLIDYRAKRHWYYRSEAKRIAETLVSMAPGALATVAATGVITETMYKALEQKSVDAIESLSFQEKQQFAQSMRTLMQQYRRTLKGYSKKGWMYRLLPLSIVDPLVREYGFNRTQTIFIIAERQNFLLWLPQAQKNAETIAEIVGVNSDARQIVMQRKPEDLQVWVDAFLKKVEALESVVGSEANARRIIINYGFSADDIDDPHCFDKIDAWVEQAKEIVREITTESMKQTMAWREVISHGLAYFERTNEVDAEASDGFSERSLDERYYDSAGNLICIDDCYGNRILTAKYNDEQRLAYLRTVNIKTGSTIEWFKTAPKRKPYADRAIVVDGIEVGSAQYTVDHNSKTYTWDIHILPKYQRNGIGLSLRNAFHNTVREGYDVVNEIVINPVVLTTAANMGENLRLCVDDTWVPVTVDSPKYPFMPWYTLVDPVTGVREYEIIGYDEFGDSDQRPECEVACFSVVARGDGASMTFDIESPSFVFDPANPDLHILEHPQTGRRFHVSLEGERLLLRYLDGSFVADFMIAYRGWQAYRIESKPMIVVIEEDGTISLHKKDPQCPQFSGHINQRTDEIHEVPHMPDTDGWYCSMPSDFFEEQSIMNKVMDDVKYKSALRREAFDAKKEKQSWAELHAPRINDFTVASLQFEAGLDRGLIENLIEEYGEEITRITGQLTLTGGLGALMHDLVVGWHKNGAHVISINPLYNNRIKGESDFDFPYPEGVTMLGDMVRNVLQKRKDIEIVPLRLESQTFYDSSNALHAKNALWKDIHVEIYEGRSTFADAPLYYIDAFYYDHGEKIFIFDEIYPDDDRRILQMAVYNYAAQALLHALESKSAVRDNILFVENEVFVSLPKNEFPNAFTHNINHTVYAPGLYKPPAYAYEILGFPEKMRADIIRNIDGMDRIDLVEYISKSQKVNFISGVGLAEHTPVLRESVFPFAMHKVEEHNENGLRNTNGALFDMWQGLEIRELIDIYKKECSLDVYETTDDEFYAALEQRPDLLAEFMERFEMVKTLYALQLLLYLKEFQTQKGQEMGGGRWLDSILAKTRYAELDKRALEEGLSSWVTRIVMNPRNETIWQEGHKKYNRLREILLQHPLASNVRRQVPYKGPDKYAEMLKMFDDTKKLAAFKKSKTRLIVGGRMFGADAHNLFKYLRNRAKELGLEERIAFIEHYNIADAPIIFRGVSGTVMLSDEFLEASATSMMKALTNGASLIGVWGGAMPELFTIIDVATGSKIDVFDFIKEHGAHNAHNVLREGLREGTYLIENGFLVAYSDYEDSDQKVEGKTPRRPFVGSLFEALVAFGLAHTNPTMRKEQYFKVLKSSPRVDIERSQARAHILMWQKAIEKETFFTHLLEGIQNIDKKTLQSLLYERGDCFEWKYKEYGYHEKVILRAKNKGLIGLLQSFYRVRNRGKEGLWSLMYHTTNNDIGDIASYVSDVFESVSELEQVRAYIESIIEDINKTGDVNEKVRYTLQILDFVERFVKAVDGYLNGFTPRTCWYCENNLKDHNLSDKERITEDIEKKDHETSTKLEGETRGDVTTEKDKTSSEHDLSYPSRLYETHTAQQLSEEEPFANLLKGLESIEPDERVGHIYNAKKHSIVALEMLDRIKEDTSIDPLLRYAYNDVAASGKLWILRIATLLHDIGKERDREPYSPSHPERGAYDQMNAALDKMPFKKHTEAVNLIRWLIRHHHALDFFARKRDVTESDTLYEIFSLLEELPHELYKVGLSMLTLITYADLKAVNPERSSDAVLYSIRIMYDGLYDYLNGGHAEWREEILRQKREWIKNSFSASKETIDTYVDLMPIQSIHGGRTRIIKAQLKHLENLDAMPRVLVTPSIESDNEPFDEIIIGLRGEDKEGIVRMFSAVLFLYGLDIHRTEINTHPDGIIWDRFICRTQYGHQIQHMRSQQEEIEKDLDRLFKAEVTIEELFREHGQEYVFNRKSKVKSEIPTRISFEQENAGSATQMRIETIDRRGLIHLITRILSREFNVSIEKALIDTFAYHVDDLFYVTHKGEPLSRALQEKIRKRIETVLSVPRFTFETSSKEELNSTLLSAGLPSLWFFAKGMNYEVLSYVVWGVAFIALIFLASKFVRSLQFSFIEYLFNKRGMKGIVRDQRDEDLYQYLRSKGNDLRMIRALFRLLRSNKPMLIEIGAGDARVAQEIARNNSEKVIVAIDVLPIWHTAEDKKKRAKNLILLKANIKDLLSLLPSSSVDTLLMVNAFPHTLPWLLKNISSKGKQTPFRDDAQIIVKPFYESDMQLLREHDFQNVGPNVYAVELDAHSAHQSEVIKDAYSKEISLIPDFETESANFVSKDIPFDRAEWMRLMSEFEKVSPLRDEAMRELGFPVEKNRILNDKEIEILYHDVAQEYLGDYDAQFVDATILHAMQTSDLAALIARELSLPEETVESIIYLAKLHDVGKFADRNIYELIIKDRHLTEEELTKVRLHAELSKRLLIAKGIIDTNDCAAEIIGSHHAWDTLLEKRGELSFEYDSVEYRMFEIIVLADHMISLYDVNRVYNNATTLPIPEKALDLFRRILDVHIHTETYNALQILIERRDRNLYALLNEAQEIEYDTWLEKETLKNIYTRETTEVVQALQIDEVSFVESRGTAFKNAYLYIRKLIEEGLDLRKTLTITHVGPGGEIEIVMPNVKQVVAEIDVLYNDERIDQRIALNSRKINHFYPREGESANIHNTIETRSQAGTLNEDVYDAVREGGDIFVVTGASIMMCLQNTIEEIVTLRRKLGKRTVIFLPLSATDAPHATNLQAQSLSDIYKKISSPDTVIFDVRANKIVQLSRDAIADAMIIVFDHTQEVQEFMEVVDYLDAKIKENKRETKQNKATLPETYYVGEWFHSILQAGAIALSKKYVTTFYNNKDNKKMSWFGRTFLKQAEIIANLSRRAIRLSIECRMAPLEQLGFMIPLLQLVQLRKSKIEWKGWLITFMTHSAASSLPIMITRLLFETNPSYYFLATLVGICNALIFGFAHEKGNQGINIFIGLIMNATIFFAPSIPLGLLGAMAWHALTNYVRDIERTYGDLSSLQINKLRIALNAAVLIFLGYFIPQIFLQYAGNVKDIMHHPSITTQMHMSDYHPYIQSAVKRLEYERPDLYYYVLRTGIPITFANGDHFQAGVHGMLKSLPFSGPYILLNQGEPHEWSLISHEEIVSMLKHELTHAIRLGSRNPFEQLVKQYVATVNMFEEEIIAYMAQQDNKHLSAQDIRFIYAAYKEQQWKAYQTFYAWNALSTLILLLMYAHFLKEKERWFKLHRNKEEQLGKRQRIALSTEPQTAVGEKDDREKRIKVMRYEELSEEMKQQFRTIIKDVRAQDPEEWPALEMTGFCAFRETRAGENKLLGWQVIKRTHKEAKSFLSQGVHVFDEFRRQGVATLLRDATYAYLIQNNCEVFVISVDPLEEAQKFHAHEIKRLAGAIDEIGYYDGTYQVEWLRVNIKKYAEKIDSERAQKKEINSEVKNEKDIVGEKLVEKEVEKEHDETAVTELVKSEFNLGEHDHRIINIMLDYTYDKGTNPDLMRTIKNYMRAKNDGDYRIVAILPYEMPYDALGLMELKNAFEGRVTIVRRNEGQTFAAIANKLIFAHDFVTQENFYVIVSQEKENMNGLMARKDMRRICMDNDIFNKSDIRSFVMLSFFNDLFKETLDTQGRMFLMVCPESFIIEQWKNYSTNDQASFLYTLISSVKQSRRERLLKTAA